MTAADDTHDTHGTIEAIRHDLVFTLSQYDL